MKNRTSKKKVRVSQADALRALCSLAQATKENKELRAKLQETTARELAFCDASKRLSEELRKTEENHFKHLNRFKAQTVEHHEALQRMRQIAKMVKRSLDRLADDATLAADAVASPARAEADKAFVERLVRASGALQIGIDDTDTKPQILRFHAQKQNPLISALIMGAVSGVVSHVMQSTLAKASVDQPTKSL